MAFVTALHLQASADAAFSCKPLWPVTRGGHCSPHIVGKLVKSTNCTQTVCETYTNV